MADPNEIGEAIGWKMQFSIEIGAAVWLGQSPWEDWVSLSGKGKALLMKPIKLASFGTLYI